MKTNVLSEVLNRGRIGRFAVIAAGLLGTQAACAYTDLEYITTSRSNQDWILLDYIPVSNTVIEATVEVPAAAYSAGTHALFCARGTTTTDKTFTGFFISDGHKFRWDCSNNGIGTASGVYAADTKYVVMCGLDGLYTNGVRLVSATPPTDFKAANKLVLFGSYTGATTADPVASGSNFADFKVYRYRVWEGEQTDANLKFDLKPCLGDNGVPVLRDTLTGDLYPTRGKSSFGYPKKTFVWAGVGTTDAANVFSRDDNWQGGKVPTASDVGCTISIPAVTHASISNDIPGLIVGEVNVSAASAFTLKGEAVALTGVGTFTSTTPDFVCEMPFALATGATNVFSIANGIQNTFAAGVLTGQGGFKKIEEGTLVLAGDNTFAGNVVLYKGYVKMSTANALGTAWKTVRIGPNHKENETHTQLQLTKAMDFDYNLEFVRQTGAYYYSARYLTCPDKTKINGTIHQDGSSQIANYLNAASGNLYVYGDVYLSYRYGLGGTVHFYGRVLKVGTGSTELQCESSSSTAHLYAQGSTVDRVMLGYSGLEFHVANAVSTNFVFNTNYQYGKAAIKLNGFDQVCNGLTTTATLFNKSEAHHNVETDANKPCRLTVKPTANRTGRYHFNGPLTVAIDSPNGSTQTVVNAESTMTADLIVSNGAFKVGYSASFPYVAGFEIGAGGTLIVTNGVTMGTGDSDFRLTTGGRLVLENGATMSVNRLFKDGETDQSAYGKTFCAPGAGVAGAVEADWIEGTGALTVNAHVVADDPRTWSGGAGAGEAGESMSDPRNWGLAPGDPSPSLTEGGLIATFATAGTNAWFAGDLAAKGIVFNAPSDFTLTAKDLSGTAYVSSTGISATGAHTYTLDTALALTLGQTWSAASGTTLRFAHGISAASDYALALNGGGTFVWEGDVSLPGNINLTGSTLLLRNASLSSTSGSLALQDTAAKIRLENATVCKPITTFTSASHQNTLVSGANTTNSSPET